MTPIATDWNKAKSLIENARKIILLAHVSPDGDAIGSILGLGYVLRAIGKEVVYAVDGGSPDSLSFLPGVDEVRSDLNDVSADLVCVLDCSDERRVGKVGEQARKLNIEAHVPWLNLDHHQTNTLFADANIVDADFTSTSEAVIRLLDYMGIPLNKEAAQCLLCGLVTDTNCFRISAVTADTFGLAQRLMAFGANLTLIVQNTVSRMPTAALRLWSQVMPTVCIEDHVVWVKVSKAARDAAGYTENSDGGLASLLLQADDAFIACTFREKEEGIELSMRAVPGFNVAQVAFSIGGGGHVLAAGATVPGTLAEVEARVIPLLKEAAKAGSPIAKLL